MYSALYQKAYRAANREKNREYQKVYRVANAEKIKPYMKSYREKNPERFRELLRDWRVKNPERQLEINRRSAKKNAERRRSNRKKWLCGERSLNYRLSECLRHRIRKALKGVAKSAKTLELLGCSVSELNQHLQAQFQVGMTWENHGLIWHIDHVIPCAKFHLQHSEEQEVCFHYTNLQPLRAEENLKKGDTYG